MERIPFQATAAGALYEDMGPLPVAVLLDNVRSMYNVGSFFRTADAASVEKLYLSGITAQPPKSAITKTALGAENTVPWEHAWEALPLVEKVRARGYEIAAVETSVHAVDLFDWTPRFPVLRDFRARGGWHPAGDFGALRYARAHPDAGRQALAERGDRGRCRDLRTAAQIPGFERYDETCLNHCRASA